jgi:prophage antirepressor-like protein
MNEVSTFTAPAGMNVRVVTIDGNPWFVAADVCRALEGARSGLSYLASRFRCPHRENWTLVAWIPTHDCSSLRLIPTCIYSQAGARQVLASRPSAKPLRHT